MLPGQSCGRCSRHHTPLTQSWYAQVAGAHTSLSLSALADDTLAAQRTMPRCNLQQTFLALSLMQGQAAPRYPGLGVLATWHYTLAPVRCHLTAVCCRGSPLHTKAAAASSIGYTSSKACLAQAWAQGCGSPLTPWQGGLH